MLEACCSARDVESALPLTRGGQGHGRCVAVHGAAAVLPHYQARLTTRLPRVTLEVAASDTHTAGLCAARHYNLGAVDRWSYRHETGNKLDPLSVVRKPRRGAAVN